MLQTKQIFTLSVAINLENEVKVIPSWYKPDTVPSHLNLKMSLKYLSNNPADKLQQDTDRYTHADMGKQFFEFVVHLIPQLCKTIHNFQNIHTMTGPMGV